MNSFGVNTLSYIVSTSLTYKTSDGYRGFIVKVKKKPTEERKKHEGDNKKNIQLRNIKQRNTST
tara:strand:+ start:320 stop:511 length:192 start_codon:yes stop_codon:yes gene_type:complete